jgi:hypothetical protein
MESAPRRLQRLHGGVEGGAAEGRLGGVVSHAPPDTATGGGGTTMIP